MVPAVIGLELTYVRIQFFGLQNVVQAQKVKALFLFKSKLFAFIHEVGVLLLEVESGALVAQDADGQH